VYVTNNPLLYVDPSGEILKLTGSGADNKKIYDLLKEMLGEKAAKNLTYTKTSEGHWVVEYKSGSGGLAINGTFGVALEDIIDSSKITSLKLTPVSDFSMDAHGGAKTTLSDEGISIKIHVDAANTNERLSRNIQGTDGKPLKFTLSVVLAHELGHAWGDVRDNTYERLKQKSWYQSTADIRLQNNNRAVQLENIERQRLGLGLKWRH
jgi:hypothetical protein